MTDERIYAAMARCDQASTAEAVIAELRQQGKGELANGLVERNRMARQELDKLLPPPRFQVRQMPTVLSKREEQVLRLLLTGLVNKEVAHELGLELSTIRSYRKTIMRKLGAKSSVDMARQGIVLLEVVDPSSLAQRTKALAERFLMDLRDMLAGAPQA